MFSNSRYLTSRVIALSVYAAGLFVCLTSPGFAEFHTGLPEPLERYLSYAIVSKAPVKGVMMKLRGSVVLPGRTDALPVEGEQFINANKPEFDWKVTAKINLILSARIRDHYKDGAGSILSKLNSFWTVINDRNIDELNRTQLARWSGLAVMAPQAFRLKDVFKWVQTGPDTIEATVTDGDVTVQHTFTFDEKGRMVRSISSDRWERYDGVYKKTGSIMERFDYAEVDGIRVPRKFIVHRIEPDGSRTKFWVGEFFDIKVLR